MFKIARSITRMSITVGVASALVATGALSASADQVPAPPVTSSADQSFVVPVDADANDPSISMLGEFYSTFTSEDLGAYTVTIGCDDGWSATPTIRVDPVGSLRTGLTGANFATELPLREQGHMCVIHTTSPAHRKLVFSSPWNKLGDHDATRLLTSGTVVNVSSNGGLG